MSDRELAALIEAARKHEMTPEEIHEQRISWVAGEIGIERPELSPEECRRRATSAALSEGKE